MYTRNGYKYLALGECFMNNAVVKTVSGATVTIKYVYNYDNHTTPGQLIGKVRIQPAESGVMFGTGNAEVTIDDYKLSGDWIQTLAPTITTSRNNDENGASATCVYTLTNIGNDTITIGEVALAAGVYTSSMSCLDPVIIERTVLESPITIEPGGVGQVTYTVCLNYPVA